MTARLTVADFFHWEGTSLAGRILVFALLIMTVVWFFLSMTTRYGRSRWPLHALIGTGILAIGISVVGVSASVIIAASESVPLAQKVDLPAIGSVPSARQAIVIPCWFAFVGTLAGLLAAVRAVIGMIREPGPRF
ncbi:MAG: hypothetical protein KDM63_06305 [Verrucomicrobiae bacterium]|nr:hypothetical protein [Verrucomicrobiae bacterium]